MDKQLCMEIKELIKEHNKLEINKFKKDINELKELVNNYINDTKSNNERNNSKKNNNKVDYSNNLPINISNNITLNMINNIDSNYVINNSFPLYIYKFVYNNNIICKISKNNNLLFNNIEIINTFSVEINEDIYRVLMLLLIKFKYKIQNEKNTFKIDFNVYKINKIFRQIYYLLDYIQNGNNE
jgi:hypothetical protein